MTNVIALAGRLQRDLSMFNIASALTQDDYVHYIIIGTEMFYNYTGQGYANVDDIMVYDEQLPPKVVAFSRDFALIERSYILVCAKISIVKWAQANKAELVSYTTDALSVAHGDKPFKNLTEMLQSLEQERRILHYKLNEAM